MEGLRHWALLLCVAAILGGILQMLLPEKEQSTGIKLILGLYIVVTALTPAADIDWDLLTTQSWQTSETTGAAADYSGWIVQYSQDALQCQLQAQLDQQAPGSVVQEITLDYDAQSGQCEVRQAILDAPGQEEAARQVAQSLLGKQIEVKFVQGGEGDALVQME